MGDVAVLINEIKQQITEHGKRIDGRVDEALKMGQTNDARVVALELAVKTNDEETRKLLQALPVNSSQREMLFDGYKKGQENREVMNKAAMTILTKMPKEVPEADLKALQMGIGASGGFLVPTQMSNEIIEKGQWKSVMLANADVINVGQVAAGKTNREDGDFTWDSTAELAQPTETAFTNLLKQMAWALTVQAAFATLSDDVIRYATVDLAARLTNKAGRSYGNKADDWYINGSGSGEPSGLRLGTDVNAVAQAGGDFDWPDLLALEAAQPVYYRDMSVFIFNDAFRTLLVQLQDTTGRPIFESAVELKKLGIDSDYKNQTGMIRLPGRSYPYFLVNDSALPNTLGAGSNETEGWFGIPEKYRIWNDGSMEMSQDSSGANWRVGQTQIKFVVRTYGALLLGEAWTKLTGAK